MIVDDQRVYYPWIPYYVCMVSYCFTRFLILIIFLLQVLQNPETEAYVDGCAVHYYTDLLVSAEVLSLTHNQFPDKFILATEACEGFYYLREMWATNV